MKCRLVLAFAAAAAIAPALALAQAQADQWNLADLYPSVAAWDADAARLDSQMTELARCKDHLGDNVVVFKRCMDLRADMAKRFARMAVYASELLAGDTGASSSLELTQKGDVLQSRLDDADSFVRPEVLRIGDKRIAELLAQDASLKIYRHPLDEILRAAPHTLDQAGESIVAKFGLLTHGSGSIYSTLTNADLPWPKVKLSTGEEVVLDGSAYEKYREVPNRADRKLVMDAFFAAHKTYERSMGLMLYGQLKEDMVYSKVRSYPDSVTRALDQDHMPIAVMDTLIAQANANLPTLHRYFKLRAKMLNVPQMAYYDIYPPLVHSDIKFPLARAKQLTLEAVAPLGPDYVAAMKKGFESRWMDTYPRPRKQSGAHMAGDAYDVHPIVLMNYNDDYESVTTLAHEWGHAMHSVLANKAQPFVTAGYPTFIAEIASTLDEELLLQHVLKVAKDDGERLLYLGSALEGLRGTFYRQAMFGEFERNVHARVDAGESLTGESFTKTYCDILKRYHGAKEGVVAIDDNYCVEWAYVPHFYNSFYVYQYATSISAASLFAQKITAGEPGARERYLDLLRAGGSDYPYELVKKAGVDLATPAPYQSIVARMNSIMDEIDGIIAKRH
jgi:oligoendopeptidase F